MRPYYRDRKEAGVALGAHLKRLAPLTQPLVLALPRGGVPVGYEVARALDAPLDIFLVRKLGVPGHEELAMGALASGGVRVLNQGLIDRLKIRPEAIEAVVQREKAELERREKCYRGSATAPPIEGREVILVDDGLATGSTMRAAVEAVKRLKPSRIIVAVPVAPPDTCDEIAPTVDEVICPKRPEPLHSVGEWYDDFEQTGDEEVCTLLKARPIVGLALGLLLLGHAFLSAAKGAGCADSPIPRAYQVGVTLGTLMTGNVPDFSNGVTVYGLTGSLPLGDDALQIQGQYGAVNQFSTYLVEINYRLLVPNPFVGLVLLGGGHFAHYDTAGSSHDGFGGNLGIGYLLPLTKALHVTLTLKGYLRERPFTGFGGGISFLL